MARESYIVEKSPGKVEELHIHAMTTRQLRQYISDKASEAQSRIDSANMKTASKAFKDAAFEITFKGTDKVMRSTSYMTKSEMRQFAYDLRQFNSLDQRSGFAKSIDWRENKKAYESFIKKQIELDKKSPWSKYKLPSGNISKKGFDEYKQFIRILDEMVVIIPKHYTPDFEKIRDNYEKLAYVLKGGLELVDIHEGGSSRGARLRS
jgi:hypothetical protein